MSGFLIVLGLAGVIVGMVLLYKKVIPAEFDGTFNNKWIQFLHDYFNFKKLYIESVLKFVFALATVLIVVSGVLGILGSLFGFIGGLAELADYGSWYFGVLVSNFFVGLLSSVLILCLGPVLIRLTYEFTMMFVLLVKNVMEINNKTKEVKADETAEI